MSSISSVIDMCYMAAMYDGRDKSFYIGMASAGLWGSSCALVAGILGILAFRVPTNNFIAWHYILVKFRQVCFGDNSMFSVLLDSPFHPVGWRRMLFIW